MSPLFRQCFSPVAKPMPLHGVIVLAEDPTDPDQEVQMIEIPEPVLQLLQLHAHRKRRSLWDEVLSRLIGDIAPGVS